MDGLLLNAGSGQVYVGKISISVNGSPKFVVRFALFWLSNNFFFLLVCLFSVLLLDSLFLFQRLKFGFSPLVV